jgi:hypothetical protein
MSDALDRGAAWEARKALLRRGVGASRLGGRRRDHHPARPAALYWADLRSTQTGRGLLQPESTTEMHQWDYESAFSVDAAVRIEATDRKGLESQGEGEPCLAHRGCNACYGPSPRSASSTNGHDWTSARPIRYRAFTSAVRQRP